MNLQPCPVLAHELLSAILFWSIFCRATHTSARTTRLSVRLALWFLGTVTCIGMAAPLVWKWEPDLYSLALLGAIVICKVVYAANWRAGVPATLQRPAVTSRI